MAKGAKLTAALPDTVVVTGASSGLGEVLAEMLIDWGSDVVGVDRAKAVAALAGRKGYVHIEGDVTAEATWAAADKYLGSGSLGLVTSAAILDVGTVLDMGPDLIRRTMDVNVLGTAMAMKAVMPAMIARGGGPIVCIGSVDATFAEQQLAVYAASKGAVRQLARTVAMDHARQGIRVNVLSPGPMMAGLFKRHMESATDSAKFKAARDVRQPTGEIVSPRDVASAVMFLLSDASRAILGADVIADGGLTTSFDFRTGAEGASV